MRVPCLALVAALAAIAPAGLATAADGNRPATPASFPDTPCLTVVDRSVDPVLHITYTVPADDVFDGSDPNTPQEVADGRSLQFFAFATQFVGEPPNWITRADVNAAAAAEASASESNDVQDSEILETSPDWPAATWIRINADDARLPITLEQAAMGIDWDTTGVPEGTYVIWAYTWDPARNLWSRRPGAVRVVDAADDVLADPPSFFFDQATAEVVSPDVDRAVRACVAAPPGSTATMELGVLDGFEITEWITWACNEPLVDGDNTFKFHTPDPEDSMSIYLRATVTDPDGVSYTAVSPALQVLPGAGAGLPASLRCTDHGSSGCRVTAREPGPLPLLVLLGLGIPRRRSRRPRHHIQVRRPSTPLSAR